MKVLDYQKDYPRSLKDPDHFWAEQAKAYLDWMAPWEKVREGAFETQDLQWFVKAKLNACYNCLDRHLPQRAKQRALIWEGNEPGEASELSYQALYEQVCRAANVLKKLGVKKGDRVCIYLPMIPEAVIAMLACARIGAVHSVIFAGFSPDAIKNRIQDAGCRIVITANEYYRGKKVIALKEQINLALKDCPEVKKVLVVKRNSNNTVWQEGRDHWWHEEITQVAADCPCETMDANDPLFILYTSGSTGKPKGILHNTGGYLVFSAMTFNNIFTYQEGEIYWCTADVGWITGHSYQVYGPLANGASVLIYEGVPNYPNVTRYWEIIDKYQVAIFYTSPTAIRALRHEGDHWLMSSSRKSLRLLGTVGEPINPEVWNWFYEKVGQSRCPIVDTWWQTETGGIMISALPQQTPLKAGAASWPFYGIKPQIVNDQGEAQTANSLGKLLILEPWPGMATTIYGNPERFYSAYFKDFPGSYFTGDNARRDEQGYYWITGRNDDILKVSGHRIGTAEVESALLMAPQVAEAAVVPVPHEIKGEAIFAFVSLKAGIQGTDELKALLVKTVRDEIGAIATPDTIQWAEALPKTRSGKIMRRLLRKIANHELDDLGDTSTLADPSVVETLIQGH